MLGNATLAMVPSSACMMVAIITTTVSQRRRRRTAGSTLIRPACPAKASEAEDRQQLAPGAAMAGVDLDDRAHADAQRWIAFLARDRATDRNALHDLHPVAGGVLRRQHSELRTGRLGQRRDLSGAFHVGIGVDEDGDRL